MFATATPTANSTLNNASMGLQNSVASTYGLGGVVVVVAYVIGALLAAQFVAPWLAKSKLLSRLGNGVVESLAYAIKGAAASAVLLVAGLPVYYIATADSSTRGLALKTIGLAVAGYAALVLVGLLADRAVTAFIHAHPDVDEWADLSPEEEESPDAVADGGAHKEEKS